MIPVTIINVLIHITFITDDDNLMIIIIACAAGGGLLLILLLVLIACCVWRRRRRTWKANFVSTNYSVNHKSSSAADIELGKVTYKQTQPGAKGM